MTAEIWPASLEGSYYGMRNLYFESATVFMFPAFSIFQLVMKSSSTVIQKMITSHAMDKETNTPKG